VQCIEKAMVAGFNAKVAEFDKCEEKAFRALGWKMEEEMSTVTHPKPPKGWSDWFGGYRGRG